MQSTFTLSTITFAAPVAANDSVVSLSSTSGLLPGKYLFANRELLRVEVILGIGSLVKVLRGRDGTETQAHGTGETVYIADGYQLFESDPLGRPGANAFVNPYINIRTGTVWIIQGDDVGPGTQARSWQQVTTAQTIGPLGVRTTTVTTPS